MNFTKLVTLLFSYSFIINIPHANANINGVIVNFSKYSQTSYVVQLANNPGGGNFYIIYPDGSKCELQKEYDSCAIPSNVYLDIDWSHTNDNTHDCLAVVLNLRSESDVIQPGDTKFPNDLTTLTDMSDCPATTAYTQSIVATGAFAIMDAHLNSHGNYIGGFKNVNNSINTFGQDNNFDYLYNNFSGNLSVANINY